MSYAEIAEMIAALGLPWAYYQFRDGTGISPPFLVYYYPDSDDFFADDKNYQKIRDLIIELYTDEKDFALEAAVENALMDAGLTYTRDEADIDTERMHMVTYTAQVAITEES